MQAGLYGTLVKDKALNNCAEYNGFCENLVY